MRPARLPRGVPALLIGILLSTATVGLWLVFGVGVWVWLREQAGSESALASGFFSLEGGVIIAILATLFVWILGMSVAMIAAGRTEAC